MSPQAADQCPLPPQLLPPHHTPSFPALPNSLPVPLVVQPQLHVDRHQRHQQLQGGLKIVQRAQRQRVPRTPAVGTARRAPQVEDNRVPRPPAPPEDEDDAGIDMACRA